MLLEERPLAAPAATVAADITPDQTPARPGRGAAVLVGAALVLAALSLLAPSAPTYDPWAWIVWGREITQLDLMTTDGPSWKPLPVLFTTPFALFGDAAPDLWLVIARAGYVVAVVMAFRLARRLGGGVPGGIAAAAALAAAPWFARNAALGNSEPLLVALLLAALDRHLDGDRRWAFGLGVACALLRPEVWPFLAVYGLWLLWRRHERPAVVIGAGLATIAVWTLPEWWGSGDPLRAMSRAQDPNPGAATFDDNPALRIVSDAFAMLPWPAYVGLGAAALLFALRRDRRLLTMLALAAGWLGIVAIMTADGGFSGNQRYLIPPVALLIVLGGAGAGWLATRIPGRAVLAVAAVGLGVLFAAPHADRTRHALETAEYQADLTDAIGPLVDRAGGADALLRCGRPYTGPFLVPHLAWVLGVHTTEVSLRPVRPAVVFRVRTLERSRAVPSLAGVDDGGPLRTLATAPGWRVVAACDPAPSR